MVMALRQLVKEAGRWAGQHESWLHAQGLKDSQSMVDPPISRGRQEKQQVPMELHVPGDARGHRFWAADIVGQDSSPRVIACTRCGAYVWKRKGNLRVESRGADAGQQLRTQKQRFLQGWFPGKRQWKLHAPARATAEEKWRAYGATGAGLQAAASKRGSPM